MTLGILNALTPFTIDMYLPSFPEISRELSVSVAQVALTVSIYFVGYALGQVIYGPLLDRFGRKPPLYFGLALYVLASLGCLRAQSLEILLAFRFLSALGGCSASVAAMSMVRDFFPPESATRVFSMLMLVLSASPLLAPTVGGLVVTQTGWRTIFGILSAMGVMDMLLVAFALPKGYAGDRNVSLRPGPIWRRFRAILANEQFFTYTLAGSFAFASLFVYVAGSPSIFMEGFQVSAGTYGAIFALLASGMIGGGQLNLWLAKKYGAKRVFRTALLLQGIFGALFLVGVLANAYGLVATIAILFAILICAGLCYPNAASLALAPFTEHIGSASALLGFIQLGIGALMSAAVGLIGMKGTLPTAAVVCVSTVSGGWVLRRAKKLG